MMSSYDTEDRRSHRITLECKKQYLLSLIRPRQRLVEAIAEDSARHAWCGPDLELVDTLMHFQCKTIDSPLYFLSRGSRTTLQTLVRGMPRLCKRLHMDATAVSPNVNRWSSIQCYVRNKQGHARIHYASVDVLTCMSLWIRLCNHTYIHTCMVLSFPLQKFAILL